MKVFSRIPLGFVDILVSRSVISQPDGLMEFLRLMASSAELIPHGQSFDWNPGLVWLHVISDGLMALAYFVISGTLVYFVRKREDLAFQWIFLCFAFFIGACGATHLLEIWAVWKPAFWLSGSVKALAALASVPTAILLVGLLPKVLAMPNRIQLKRANEALEKKIQDRMQDLAGLEVKLKAEILETKRTEEEVRKLSGELERRVEERTAQLGGANRDLQNEIAERKLTEALLRESEERFRFLVMSVKDYAIYGLDAEGRVAGWNAGSERITGYKASEIIGKPISRFYAPEDAAEGKPEQLLRAAIVQGRVEDEGWRVRKDGSRYWANVVITVLRDDAGRLRGFGKITRDVTERKQAEEVLQKSEAALRERTVQLEASNKELEAFSYSVSHDLRAPLRAIDGFSQALQEDCTDRLNETGLSHLTRIRTATQRMGQLIDGLLTLSRLTRAEVRREEVNLSQEAQSIVDQLSHSDRTRQLEFVLQPDLKAFGDPRLLRVVLDNLLRNAWKFSRKRPSARIEFGVTDRDGPRAFFIRDNGAGFDMVFQGKLFGAFQRLHPVSEFEGTGIGLATVQRIIQRHGGRIWAESAPDQGATFYFTLTAP